MNEEHYEYIITHRIADYAHDIEKVLESNDLQYEDRERIKQDKVIIQELEKILTGKKLNFLSYVD